MRARCLLAILLLVVPIASTSAATATLPVTLRVDILGIVKPRRVVIRPSRALRLSTGWTLPSGTPITIEVDSGKLRVRTPGRPAWLGSRLDADSDAPIDVDVTGRSRRQRRLPAPVHFEFFAGRIAIRADMSLESLVASAVSAELDSCERLEALRAGAIAIRSYLAVSVARHAREGFDVCDSTHCLHSVGLIGQDTSVRRLALEAAAGTAGKVLVRDGHIVTGFFSACCGGRTTTPARLWGIDDSGDFTSVECRWCRGTKYYSWTRTIAASSVASAVADRSGPPVRSDYSLRADRDESGWVTSVHIVSSAGDRRMPGDVFRTTIGRRLGWDALPSPNFKVERERGAFVFRGAGFGHGIGLCLEGAQRLAVAGQTGEAIVLHYFPAASVDTLPHRTGDV